MMRRKGALGRNDLKGKPKGMWIKRLLGREDAWKGNKGKEKSTKGRRETIVRKHCLIFVSHHGVFREWLV